MKNIGITGGGQLSKMLCESAINKSPNTFVLEENINSCSKTVDGNFFCNSFNYIDILSNCCDVIIYEFENINIEVIEFNCRLCYSETQVVSQR